MTSLDIFYLVPNIILLGLLFVVLFCRQWIMGKVDSYFKLRLSKELEDYRQELIKELEFYRTSLLKDVELYKLNVENKKYITTKIIDRRLEAYEKITELMNKVVIDVTVYSESADNPQVRLFVEKRLRENMDLLNESIQKYSFYIKLDVDTKITALNRDVHITDWNNRTDVEKLLKQFGDLRELLKRDMLITEDFSSLDKKIAEK